MKIRVPHVRRGLIASTMGILLIAAPIHAQEPSATPQQPESGKVVFSTGQTPQATTPSPDIFPKDPITNAERSAVVILSDDLDLHLTPSESGEEAHALLILRNTSSAPLKRIPLQISSTLRWQSITSPTSKQLTFTQSPITTDADHTGYAQEAVLTPDHPLAAGASLTLSVFYSGQIPASTARLELIGTPAEKAAETDWDAIAPTSDESSTALRGFGEVLWYPVAAPTALLGEGNQLFETVAHQRLLNTAAAMRLRLTLVYAGDPPDAVIFNGRLQPLTRIPDNADQVIDEAHGIATATFPFAPIGFRAPNLFITAQHVTQTASPLLSVVSPVPEAADPYALAVDSLKPLFNDWIAPAPITPLLLLEHPGAPFEDSAFIAAHLSAAAQPENIAVDLVRALTHAFFSATAPTSVWLDQGLPEFMSLLWTERTQGREAAIAQLQQNALPLALIEPDLAPNSSPASNSNPAPALAGTPLTHAESDVYLHFKSAAVLWQLRDILGDETLRRALTIFRHSLSLTPALDHDQTAFEKSLEHTSGTDLSWFFDDWVYNDRSLPDLTVTHVVPRPMLPRAGRAGGYLVVVDVRNDGFAAAEVPVTVRSGTLTATERLRIPARSTASTHIVFEGTPDTLQVNDGSVPELRSSLHTTQISTQQ
jgi:hypothetical protein